MQCAHYIQCFPTTYPSLLGRQRQYGMRSLPNTSTHGQQWESDPQTFSFQAQCPILLDTTYFHSLSIALNHLSWFYLAQLVLFCVFFYIYTELWCTCAFSVMMWFIIQWFEIKSNLLQLHHTIPYAALYECPITQSKCHGRLFKSLECIHLYSIDYQLPWYWNTCFNNRFSPGRMQCHLVPTSNRTSRLTQLNLNTRWSCVTSKDNIRHRCTIFLCNIWVCKNDMTDTIAADVVWFQVTE